jgi:hypothetical protein
MEKALVEKVAAAVRRIDPNIVDWRVMYKSLSLDCIQIFPDVFNPPNHLCPTGNRRQALMDRLMGQPQPYMGKFPNPKAFL